MIVLFLQNQEGEMKKAESEGMYYGHILLQVFLTNYGDVSVNELFDKIRCK